MLFVMTKCPSVKKFEPYFLYLIHTKTFCTKKIKKMIFNKKMLQNLFGNIARNGKMHLCAQFGNVIKKICTSVKKFCAVLFVLHLHTQNTVWH
jgi:hypothetical protein